MSAAAAHPVALPPSRRPENRPLTLGMRIALGQLCTGALYREAGRKWRSRAFPGEPVKDSAVMALEGRGYVLLQEYDGLYGIRRACVVITPAGRRAYGAGGLSSHTPPPVSAEAVLVEVEAALSLLTQESERLGRELAQVATLEAEARKLEREAQARLKRIETRLTALETARGNLDARRVELRCLVVEAAERLMGEVQS